MLDCVYHYSIDIVHDYEYSKLMKNIPHPGEIIREDVIAAPKVDNSKTTVRLERARALRADLGDIEFDAIDIDVFKRNGRKY